MMKKHILNKLGTVFLSATMLAGGGLPLMTHAQADTSSNEVETNNLPGTSENNPDILRETKGTGIPTNTWNIKTQGRYNFSGSSNYNELYTNYQFTGYAEYYVSVKNTSNKAIEVRALKGINTAVKVVTIPANSTKSFSITGIKASDKIFLKFFGNGGAFSFSGYID